MSPPAYKVTQMNTCEPLKHKQLGIQFKERIYIYSSVESEARALVYSPCKRQQVTNPLICMGFTGKSLFYFEMYSR